MVDREIMGGEEIKSQSRFRPSFKEVTRYNIFDAVAEITTKIGNVEYITIDTEFTGLGTSNKSNSKDLEYRYATLMEVAKTRGIFSIGIGLFKRERDEQSVEENVDKVVTYSVSCYNFLTISYAECVLMEPSSIEFLINSGFSIDRLVKVGSPYIPNHEVSNKSGNIDTNKLLRSLFETIICAKKPIVIHNGLLDLLFLYQNFYNTLPPDLNVFVADLFEMFSGGIYDTKAIAEYVEKESASYLKYLFRKYERQQEKLSNELKPYVRFIDDNTSIPPHSLTQVAIPKNFRQRKYMKSSHLDTGKPYCEQYALHGNCSKISCDKTHDLDFILECEENPNERRKRPTLVHTKIETNETPFIAYSSHSACYDAFMTGFVFAVQTFFKKHTDYMNKIYLMNMCHPLTVRQSIYTSTSKAHKKSMNRIFAGKKNLSSKCITKRIKVENDTSNTQIPVPLQK